MNIRFRHASLLSASLIAMVTVANVAYAQTAPVTPSTPSNPQPAQDTTAAVPADGGEIVVTGIRGSIQRAQELKRNALAVVEAITSEDLGKFSDQSLGDALQRVPGVQIERNDDGRSGDKISIRGLGPQYVNVLVNGRELVSYGDAGNGGTPNVNLRNFNLDAVPPEIIGGLLAYKTPLAQNPESGLAGLINIQTIRPLDYRRPKRGGSDKFFGTVAIRGEGDTLVKKVEPRFSGAVGAKLFGNTLGLYIAGVYANTPSQNDEVQITQAQRSINIGSTVHNNVFAPFEFDAYTIPSEHERRSLTGAIQWRPNSDFEVNADLTYNQYNNNQLRQRNEFDVNADAIYGGVQADGDVTIEDNVVTGFRGKRGGVSSVSYLSEPSLETNKSRTWFGGLNAAWTGENAKVSFDYGHSKVEYFSNLQVVYGNGQLFSSDYNNMNSVPNFTIGTDPTTTQASLIYYYGGQKRLHNEANSLRADLEFNLNPSFKLKVGARFRQSDIDSRTGSIFAIFNPGAPATVFGSSTFAPVYTAAQLNAAAAAAFPQGQRASVFPAIGLGALQYGSFNAACASAISNICALDIFQGSAFNGPFPTSGTPAADAGTISFNGGNSFSTREKNYSGYVQIDGAGDLFGVPAEGNLGLRVVRVDLLARSFAEVDHRGTPTDGNVTTSRTNTPTVDTNFYTRVLPNLNINIHPIENSAIRFGIAQTISLPQYEDARPSGTIIIQDADPAGVRRNNATFNNTKLKPVSSRSYDLTFEYYTKNKGSVVISMFYKNIRDFILNTSTVGQTITGQPGVFEVAGPRNIASGTAKGIEIGVNQPFTFLPSPFDGLGMQANYTYVDSSFDSPLPEAQYGLPGASKHNVNVVAYYEKYGLGVRLGYTYRSSNLLGLGGSGYGFNYPTIEEGHSNLDLNLTYAFDPKTELTLSATNLTRERRRDYQLSQKATFTYFERPVGYSFGIRRSF